MADEEQTPAPEADQQQPDDAPQEGNVDDLPEWARKALTKANKETANYRTKLREVEPLAKRAQELEEASKTEAERLNDRLTAAEQRAQEAELRALRLEVASAKGLTPTQAKRLVGATKEELEADADDLLASFTDDNGTPRRPKPTPAQGTQQGGAGVSAAQEFAGFLNSKL